MSSDVIDQYLSLVEQLYNAYYFDVNAEFEPPKEEEYRQKVLKRNQIYNSLIQLLFKHDAISDDAYCELHKVMPIELNFIKHPGVPGKYVSDSLDDFRLALEYGFVESDPNNNLRDDYLDDRYGYSICVRPNTPNGYIKRSDLCVIRFEGTVDTMRSVTASYWEVKQLLTAIRRDMEI